VGICVTPEAGSASPPATCTCSTHVSGPRLCSVTNGHPACILTMFASAFACSLASLDVHAATRPVRLAVVPVCVHGNSHAWYPCVPRGMFFLLVPASSPVASACTSYYVCPSRGPLRVARVCPPVMSAATRSHALPHYSLYSGTPPARRARLPCHLHLTVIYTLLSHRTVLACAFLPRSAMLTRPCRCPCFHWTHWASLFTPVRASERPL